MKVKAIRVAKKPDQQSDAYPKNKFFVRRIEIVYRAIWCGSHHHSHRLFCASGQYVDWDDDVSYLTVQQRFGSDKAIAPNLG